MLAVLAMPAIFSPSPIASLVLMRDYPFMCALVLVTMIGAFFPKGDDTIGRPTAIVLLLMWLGYYVWLFFA
jgi:Ca2+/Na+ antiporter